MPLRDLWQDGVGLITAVHKLRVDSDGPQFSVTTARLGDLATLWAGTPRQGTKYHVGSLDGAGIAEGDEHSIIPALAEALERYCSSTFDHRQFISATAEELGAKALDLDDIPRCSDTELADRQCPLVLPRKDKSIRWVPGVSLVSGEVVYIPVSLVYLYVPTNSIYERLAIGITTGCAAHTSLTAAIVNGILEVVERDALSLTWLQRFSLSRISRSSLIASSLLSGVWEQHVRASTELTVSLFDATTEFGIPVVYCIQESAVDSTLKTVVSCASALTAEIAAAKALRDVAMLRVCLRHAKKPPSSRDDFTQVTDGGIFMAREDQYEAFSFLTGTTRETSLMAMKSATVSSQRASLEDLLRRFKRAKIDLYVVDLTTDEALRAGMRVVRVVIPALQPFSFIHRARYLGHRRLYEAPAKLGYRSYSETELNHHPQPFA